MPAYVLVDVAISDPARYEEYKKLTPGTLALYDGRFIARGGRTETLEGNWTPERVVLLEFPTWERAKAWYDSPEYAPARALRQSASTGRLVLVQGVE